MKFENFVKKVAKLAAKVGENGGHLFFKYNAHVEQFEIEFYKAGWKDGREDTFYVTFYYVEDFDFSNMWNYVKSKVK